MSAVYCNLSSIIIFYSLSRNSIGAAGVRILVENLKHCTDMNKLE